MNPLTWAGVAISLSGIGYVLVTSGSWNVFLNVHALMLVYGGSIGVTMLTYPWKIIRTLPKALRLLLFPPAIRPPAELIEEVLKLHQAVTTSGVDSVDLRTIADEFLRSGLRMILEDMDESAIREELETELRATGQRHHRIVEVFRGMAVAAPIFGLLGTVMGVVEVLKHLSSPEEMGQYMAVAVVATFHGILAANLIYLPTASKLEVHSESELLDKEIMAAAILGMKRRELPSLLRRKLDRFVRRSKEA